MITTRNRAITTFQWIVCSCCCFSCFHFAGETLTCKKVNKSASDEDEYNHVRFTVAQYPRWRIGWKNANCFATTHFSIYIMVIYLKVRNASVVFAETIKLFNERITVLHLSLWEKLCFSTHSLSWCVLRYALLSLPLPHRSFTNL